MLGIGRVASAVSPLKCSSSGAFCQFPFILDGEVKWDCVSRSGRPVCNTRQSSQIQQFTNTRNFEFCEKCPLCGESSQDGKRNYDGFTLDTNNHDHVYKEVEDKEECRLLCQLAKGCNFFQFRVAANSCVLKYGVGRASSKEQTIDVSDRSLGGREEFYFGPAYCPGGSTLVADSGDQVTVGSHRR